MCTNSQASPEADLQSQVAGLSTLCPGVGLNTKQAAQESQKSKISVIVGKQCINTGCKTSNITEIATNQPEYILKTASGLLCKLIIQLVKTIIHKDTP